MKTPPTPRGDEGGGGSEDPAPVTLSEAFRKAGRPDVDPKAPAALTAAERAELAEVAGLCELYFPTRDDLIALVLERRGSYPIHAYRLGVEAYRDQPRQKWSPGHLIGFIRKRANDPPWTPPAPGTGGGPDAPRMSRTTERMARVPDEIAALKAKRNAQTPEAAR